MLLEMMYERLLSMQAETGDSNWYSGVSLTKLETITVGHLGLEDETDGESGEKDKDVQPVESAHFEIVSIIQIIHEMIIWIVAWEENSPRAHEEVWADERGLDDHARHDIFLRRYNAGDSTNGIKGIFSPLCAPFASCQLNDQGEKEKATEPAHNRAKDSSISSLV